MSEPNLQVIVFSKDRPLQLHGYLSSFFKHCAEPVVVKVLVQMQPAWFESAYSEIQREFAQVSWHPESDFQTDLNTLIGDSEYTMFGCDDVVFTHEWGVGHAFQSPEVLGLSLRLGRHITRDMFGQPMAQPNIDSLGNRWRVDEGAADWGYPWEVLGTVYRTEFARRMVERVQANSPSQLEERGSRVWSEETDLRTLACWTRSRLVVPTVNLVQQEFPNGICGEKPLDVGFLLDCWNHGLRLDVDRYDGMVPDSWRIPDFLMRRA